MDALHDAASLRAHPSAVARATGIPKRTLQDWIQPYVEQRTNHGYPRSLWQKVLREHEWLDELDLVSVLHRADSRVRVLHGATQRENAQEAMHARADTVQHSAAGLPEVAVAEVVSRATQPLERLLTEERARAERERERASTAEQAAAMWQERARNLEAQVEQLLALPAHEEEPEPAWHRWTFWRRR